LTVFSRDMMPLDDAATPTSAPPSHSGHVTPEQAAAAYHSFCTVTAILATYSANVAHRAAPLPDAPALGRLIRLMLGCTDDVIILHEHCPSLLHHSAFNGLRTRANYHAPPSMLHWTLVASIRLMFGRWPTIASIAAASPRLPVNDSPTPPATHFSVISTNRAAVRAPPGLSPITTNSAEHAPSDHEIALHGTTVRMFEFFAKVSKWGVNQLSPASSLAQPGDAPPAVPARGAPEAAGLHPFRTPIAEVIRDWGLLISSGSDRVAAVVALSSPVPVRSPGAVPAPIQSANVPPPPQWPVLRRPDVFLAAVSALMVPECPPKVVAAVARYLTLFHSTELAHFALAGPPNLTTTPPPEPAPAYQGDVEPMSVSGAVDGEDLPLASVTFRPV
jgi:hypothetical protein